VKNRFAGIPGRRADETEQKELRELLVKAERLAAIGQGRIAMRHEINNPLHRSSKHGAAPGPV